MVVREFTSLGGEAQVCDGWDFEVLDLKACRPFIIRLVLQFEAQVLILEVGQAGFGGDLSITDSASLAIR